MAVFRIEKTRDYTVMANHHLRNTKLSLKAKGLLSLMLSLPEDWDYTTKGLAKICRDGVDSICSAVNELEEHGYVIRERIRNAKGQLTDIQYTILEKPELPKPGQGKPKHSGSRERIFLMYCFGSALSVKIAITSVTEKYHSSCSAFQAMRICLSSNI